MRRIALSLMCVGLLVACTPEEPVQTSPPPTSTVSTVSTPSPSPTTSAPSAVATPSPSPSPTAVESFPPPPATESPEQAAVRAAWTEYYTQFAKYAADPGLGDLTELTMLVTDEWRMPAMLTATSASNTPTAATSSGTAISCAK